MAREPKPGKIRVENSPMGARDVGRWLKTCLYMIVEEDEEARRLVLIQCCHIIQGNKRGEHVFDIKVPRNADEDWAEATGCEIYSKLQLEVANLGGIQRYVLYAYHDRDNERHTSRFVLKFEGISEDDTDLMTEGTTKDGLVAQLARHSETQMKIMTGMVGMFTQTTQGIIARQNTMIEKLLEEKLDNIELVQAMSADKEEREVKMIQAKAKAEGVKNLVEKLGLLLPSVANKLAGQQVFPVQETAVSMMTKALVTSLATDEERMAKLVALMKPEEVVAFSNLYEAVSTQPSHTDGKNDPETH